MGQFAIRLHINQVLLKVQIKNKTTTKTNKETTTNKQNKTKTHTPTPTHPHTPPPPPAKFVLYLNTVFIDHKSAWPISFEDPAYKNRTQYFVFDKTDFLSEIFVYQTEYLRGCVQERSWSMREPPPEEPE